MNDTIPSVSRALFRNARALRRRGSAGLTLVEMLVVIAVAGVLTTLAVPAMTATLDSIRLSAAFDTFLSGMYLARSEAISRTGPVVLCKSANGVSCSPTGGWEQGWIIFGDTNNNGQRDDAERLVTQQPGLSPGLKLTGNLTVAKYVSFGPTGAAKLVGGGFQAGTLTLCRQSPGSGEARQVVLNVAGRLRVQKTAAHSCA
jgi:type IV fimbrial biogenesis protein FimT